MTKMTGSEDLTARASTILGGFGFRKADYWEGPIEVTAPISGQIIGRVRPASPSEVSGAVEAAHAAFLEWREIPAPKRGELIGGDRLSRAAAR